METTTPTPTPITPAPLNTPSAGNGKKFIIIGALVLVLGGGAFFLSQGGSTLKGSFVAGGANCPVIADKDIASAKLLEPDANGKYILSVKYSDETSPDPLSITWSSTDLPSGAVIKSYLDNQAEVSGTTTCPFIFTATVKDADSREVAQKKYYINPPAAPAAEARPTTDTRRAAAPADTAVVPTINELALEPKITRISPLLGFTGEKVKMTITGTNFEEGATVTLLSGERSVEELIAGSDIVVSNGSRITFTLSIGKTASTGKIDIVVKNPTGKSVIATKGFEVKKVLKLEVGSEVLVQNTNPTDGDWHIAHIKSNGNSPDTYFSDNDKDIYNLDKTQIALFAQHPERVSIGQRIIVCYKFDKNSSCEYTLIDSTGVTAINGDIISATVWRNIAGKPMNFERTFDRKTEVWVNAQDGGW